MPRVSVIIPAYNAAALLGPTLQTTLASQFDDLEIVVVNDGSRDQTAEVAASYGPRVRVISQNNAGMSASRNRGIAESDSEFIALLDSDDIWHPAKLRLQIAALDAHPDHGFCFTEFSSWHGEDCNSWLAEHRTGQLDTTLSGWIYHKMILTNWALPSSVVLRRSLWDTLGPFLCADHQTDDWEYFVRASRETRSLKLAESMVLYRQHPASLSRKLPLLNNTELMRESLIQRFGTQSPDGCAVDQRELTRRRHVGWCNFASAHCSRGNLGIGLRAFGERLAQGPYRLDALTKMGKSLVRRIVPSR